MNFLKNGQGITPYLSLYYLSLYYPFILYAAFKPSYPVE